MKSGLDFGVIVSASEETLRRMGRAYSKSDVGHTVELEVAGDDQFAVRIRRLEPLPRYNPLLGGLVPRDERDEVDVAIALRGGAEAKGTAAKFVGELMASLPSEPWKGLGFVETFTAKSLWRRWAAGLEER